MSAAKQTNWPNRRWLVVALLACISLAAGATLTRGPRPVCNGSCTGPADTGDCAVCCNSKTDGCDCRNNFEQGSPRWRQCLSNCDTR